MYILLKKYMYIHIYILCTHAHLQKYIHLHRYTCAYCLHSYIHADIHVYIKYMYTYGRLQRYLHMSVYVCIYVHIYIYVYRCGCVRLIRFPCPRDPTYSFKWKLGHTSRSCSSVTYTHNYGIRMYMWFPYVHVLSKRRFVAERETVRPPERSARVITWTREKLF